MDENVPHDLVLECRRLAQQLSKDDGLDTLSRSRKSKEKTKARLVAACSAITFFSFCSHSVLSVNRVVLPRALAGNWREGP